MCLWVCVSTSVCPTERPRVGLGGPGGMGTGSCSQERDLSLHQTLPESLTSLLCVSEHMPTSVRLHEPAHACHPCVSPVCVCEHAHLGVCRRLCAPAWTALASLLAPVHLRICAHLLTCVWLLGCASVQSTDGGGLPTFPVRGHRENNSGSAATWSPSQPRATLPRRHGSGHETERERLGVAV